MARQRVQWLDALRGFTMMLVVTNHVYGMTFVAPSKQSMFMSLCLLFRMPLFFFISGFLAYKASFTWDVRQTGALIAKKLRVQIVPTVVLMTAFIALTAKPFLEKLGAAWQSPTKGGYWFTLVLLEMFMAYYAVCFLAARVAAWRSVDAAVARRRTSWLLFALWALALFGYSTLYMPRYFSWYKDAFYKATSLTECVRYAHFFLFGNLCHRHWDRVQRWLDTPWLFPLLVAVAFVGAGDYLRWHNLRMMWANLPRTLSMYALVALVVACFRHYAAWFDSRTAVGRSLQYVGVRTLDVYLLHYFFLPKLPAVGKWLKANPPGFVLEGTSALALAVLVVVFSLLASQVLRVSPFLRKWLFGRD